MVESRDLFKYLRNFLIILSGVVICSILLMACERVDKSVSTNEANARPVLLEFPSWAQKSCIVHLNVSDILNAGNWKERLVSLKDQEVELLYISSDLNYEISDLLADGKDSRFGSILLEIDRLGIRLIIDWRLAVSSGDNTTPVRMDGLIAGVSQYNVDGFMFIGTDNVEVSTWKDIHKALAGMRRPLLLLGSENVAMLRNAGYLHGDKGLEFFEIITGMIKRSHSPYNLEPYLVLDQEKYTQGFHVLSSSETNSLQRLSAGPMKDALTVMALSFQGMSMINGDELWSQPSEAERGDKMDSGLNEPQLISELIKLKRENKSLWNDPYIVNTTLVDMGKPFIHYKRETAGNRVDFIINISGEPLSYLPSAEYKGVDFFSGESVHFYPAKPLDIPPYGFKIVIKQ